MKLNNREITLRDDLSVAAVTRLIVMGILMGLNALAMLYASTLLNTARIETTQQVNQQTGATETYYVPVGSRQPFWFLYLLFSLANIGALAFIAYLLVDVKNLEDEEDNGRGDEPTEDKKEPPQLQAATPLPHLSLEQHEQQAELETIPAQVSAGELQAIADQNRASFNLKLPETYQKLPETLQGLPETSQHRLVSARKQTLVEMGRVSQPVTGGFDPRINSLLQKYSYDVVKDLVGLRKGLAIVGAPRVGKSTTEQVLVAETLHQYDHAIIKAVLTKSDSLMGLNRVPGAVQVIDPEHGKIQPLFDELENALALIAYRQQFSREERAKFPPYILILGDHYSTYIYLDSLKSSEKFKGLSNDFVAKVGRINTLGPEVFVTLCSDTHSTKLDCLGFKDRDGRRAITMFVQGLIKRNTEDKFQGDYDLPYQAATNAQIVAQAEDRKRFTDNFEGQNFNLFQLLKSVSKATGRPLFFSNHETPQMGLLPDYEWVNSYRIPEQRLVQMAKDLKVVEGQIKEAKQREKKEVLSSIGAYPKHHEIAVSGGVSEVSVGSFRETQVSGSETHRNSALGGGLSSFSFPETQVSLPEKRVGVPPNTPLSHPEKQLVHDTGELIVQPNDYRPLNKSELSERMTKLFSKGLTTEQVREVCHWVVLDPNNDEHFQVAQTRFEVCRDLELNKVQTIMAIWGKTPGAGWGAAQDLYNTFMQG